MLLLIDLNRDTEIHMIRKLFLQIVNVRCRPKHLAIALQTGRLPLGTSIFRDLFAPSKCWGNPLPASSNGEGSKISPWQAYQLWHALLKRVCAWHSSQGKHHACGSLVFPVDFCEFPTLGKRWKISEMGYGRPWNLFHQQWKTFFGGY